MVSFDLIRQADEFVPIGYPDYELCKVEEIKGQNWKLRETAFLISLKFETRISVTLSRKNHQKIMDNFIYFELKYIFFYIWSLHFGASNLILDHPLSHTRGHTKCPKSMWKMILSYDSICIFIRNVSKSKNLIFGSFLF